jgi:hypothetical protein
MIKDAGGSLTQGNIEQYLRGVGNIRANVWSPEEALANFLQ